MGGGADGVLAELGPELVDEFGCLGVLDGGDDPLDGQAVGGGVGGAIGGVVGGQTRPPPPP